MERVFNFTVKNFSNTFSSVSRWNNHHVFIGVALGIGTAWIVKKAYFYFSEKQQQQTRLLSPNVNPLIHGGKITALAVAFLTIPGVIYTIVALKTVNLWKKKNPPTPTNLIIDFTDNKKNDFEISAYSIQNKVLTFKIPNAISKLMEWTFPKSAIEKLPNEILLKIFSLLDSSSALKLSSTCKTLAKFRLEPSLQFSLIFRLSMAQMHKIPSMQTAGYAQFYENHIWRVYTNGNISLDECDALGLNRVLDVHKPWDWSFSQIESMGFPSLHSTLPGLYGTVREGELLLFHATETLITGEINNQRQYRSVKGLISLSANGNLSQNEVIPSGYCAAKDLNGTVSYIHNFYLKKCTIYQNNQCINAFNDNETTFDMRVLSNNRMLTVQQRRLFNEDFRRGVDFINSCKIWDITSPSSPQLVYELKFSGDDLISAAIIGSKEQWVIFFGRKNCEVWKLKEKTLLKKLSHPSSPRCYTLINDEWLVLGYADKTVRIWNIFKGTTGISYKFDMEIFDVRFDQSKHKLWVAGDSHVAVLNLP